MSTTDQGLRVTMDAVADQVASEPGYCRINKKTRYYGIRHGTIERAPQKSRSGGVFDKPVPRDVNVNTFQECTDRYLEHKERCANVSVAELAHEVSAEPGYCKIQPDTIRRGIQEGRIGKTPKKLGRPSRIDIPVNLGPKGEWA